MHEEMTPDANPDADMAPADVDETPAGSVIEVTIYTGSIDLFFSSEALDYAVDRADKG